MGEDAVEFGAGVKDEDAKHFDSEAHGSKASVSGINRAAGRRQAVADEDDGEMIDTSSSRKRLIHPASRRPL